MSRRPTRKQLTTHVSFEVADAVTALATTRGVSISAAVEVLISEALRVNVEHEHASLIEAVVERTIRQCLWGHIERLSDMTARAALYGDEGRRMTFQVLVNLLGPDKARVFRREIHSTAYQRLQEPVEPAPAPEANSVWPAAPTRS